MFVEGDSKELPQEGEGEGGSEHSTKSLPAPLIP